MNSQPAPETLAALVELYAEANIGVKSIQTSRLYRYTIKRFDEHLGRASTLADFTDANIVGFIRSREKAGLKAASCEREGNKLLSLWRWAAARGWCDLPMMRIAKNAPATPTAWSRQELKRLFDAAEVCEFEVSGGIPGNVYFTALLRLIWDSGERIGAITQVRWADIDIGGRWVTFRKETRKGRGKASDNVQRLSRITVRALAQLRPLSLGTDPEKLCQRINVAVVKRARSEIFTVIYLDPNTWKRAERSTGTTQRLEAERFAFELQARLRDDVRHAHAENRGQHDPSAYVFPGAQPRQDGGNQGFLYDNLRRIQKSAGLSCDSRSMFHRIRRTHATYLFVAGGDPTASLGHYSDQMTRDYYLDPRYTHKGYAADLLSGGILEPLRRLVRRVKVAIGLW